MKAAVTLMLAALLVLLAASAASAAMFRDVPTDSWIYNVTESFLDKGILEGYRSHRRMAFTRYEFAMATARVLDKLQDESLMAKMDSGLALQLLGLVGEFELELKEIYGHPEVQVWNAHWPKDQIARLADEKLFIPLIGE